jgi:hypothetical protein
MQTEEQLKEMVTSATLKIAALTLVVNDDINAELQAATNIPTHIGTSNLIWLEISYLGCYLLQQKITGSMSEEEQKKFAPIFKEEFISTVLDRIWRLSGKERTDVEAMLKTDYDNKLKKYSEYRGDISTLFKEELKNTFNTRSGKIKFINGTEKTKLKIAFFLNSLSKDKELIKEHGDDLILPDNILTPIAMRIVKLFRDAELES